MDSTLAPDGYESWVSMVFRSASLGRVVLISATVSAGVFLAGAVVSVGGGLDYFDTPEGYLGAFAAFWLLTCLGAAEGHYVEVWDDVRPAFDVDDETYRAAVTPHLFRSYDTRRVLAYAAGLAVPYVGIVAAAYLPGSPLRAPAVELFLEGETDYGPSVASTLVFFVLGVPNAVLFATVLNGFVAYLGLVRDVSTLPFRDVYLTTAELGPIAAFTVASATAWFVGVSLVVFWIHVGLSGTLGAAAIAVLVGVGVVFFLAPQLILHDALRDAKRSEVAALRNEYARLQRRMEREELSPDDVTSRLEVLDRRMENAKAIRTWVYDLSSIGRLVAAAALPGVTLVQEVVSTAGLVV
jgi:hypothetical protein